MMFSQKRKCSGCRALTHDGHCQLGHRVKDTADYSRWIPFAKIVPLDKCYKPKTTKDFFIAEDIINGH